MNAGDEWNKIRTGSMRASGLGWLQSLAIKQTKGRYRPIEVIGNLTMRTLQELGLRP
jgi:hypothetical protein